jgi:hypothetical protein
MGFVEGYGNGGLFDLYYRGITSGKFGWVPWNGSVATYFRSSTGGHGPSPTADPISGSFVQRSDLRTRGDGKQVFKGFYFGPFKPPR